MKVTTPSMWCDPWATVEKNDGFTPSALKVTHICSPLFAFVLCLVSGVVCGSRDRQPPCFTRLNNVNAATLYVGLPQPTWCFSFALVMTAGITVAELSCLFLYPSLSLTRKGVAFPLS